MLNQYILMKELKDSKFFLEPFLIMVWIAINRENIIY